MWYDVCIDISDKDGSLMGPWHRRFPVAGQSDDAVVSRKRDVPDVYFYSFFYRPSDDGEWPEYHFSLPFRAHSVEDAENIGRYITWAVQHCFRSGVFFDDGKFLEYLQMGGIGGSGNFELVLNRKMYNLTNGKFFVRAYFNWQLNRDWIENGYRWS